MAKLKVMFGEDAEVVVESRLEETPTIRQLLTSLPFTSKAQTWGDEVYFSVPFHAARESDSRMEMEVGEVAFWPDGDALAIFFGPTPASEGSAPMAYSPCNMVGRVVGDATVLRRVKPGAFVEVTEA